MSETARSVITDALQEILVLAAEQPIEADEMQTGIRYLNRMMSAYDVKGISLGYTVVDNPADAITVQAGAIDGIITNLAVKLAPIFGMTVSPELSVNAREGYRAMLDLAVKSTATQMPATMPRGSGNETFYEYDNFYSKNKDAFANIKQSNNTTETVIAVIDVPVIIGGSWVVNAENDMTGTIAGRIAFDSGASKQVKISATALIESVAGFETIGILIAINGNVVASTKTTTFAASPIYLSTTLDVALAENDYIELFALNESAAANVLISNAELKVSE